MAVRPSAFGISSGVGIWPSLSDPLCGPSSTPQFGTERALFAQWASGPPLVALAVDLSSPSCPHSTFLAVLAFSVLLVWGRRHVDFRIRSALAGRRPLAAYLRSGFSFGSSSQSHSGCLGPATCLAGSAFLVKKRSRTLGSAWAKATIWAAAGSLPNSRLCPRISSNKGNCDTD